MEIRLALIAVFAGSLLALAYAFFRTRWIYARPPGDEVLQRISGYIAAGRAPS